MGPLAIGGEEESWKAGNGGTIYQRIELHEDKKARGGWAIDKESSGRQRKHHTRAVQNTHIEVLEIG